MDELKPAENVVVAEASNEPALPASEPTTSTPVEQVTTEPVATNDIAPTTPEVQTPVVEHQPKPAERKIRSLIEENKRYKEEFERLQVPSTSPSEPLSKSIDQTLDEYGNVDLAKLDKIADARAAQAATSSSSLEVTKLRQELAMKDALAQNAADVAVLEREPELDELSPQFNKVLEQKIIDAYKARAVKPNPYNPQVKYLDTTVRLADVAQEYLEVARAAVEQGKSQANASLASLADNAAMTPGIESAPEKSFADMTTSEMEVHLRATGHKI